MHFTISKMLLTLVFFAGFQVVTAFRWVQNVNFTYCYQYNVSTLNTSDLSDNKIQYFLFDSATGERIRPDEPYLTLYGCEALCHDGYQLWPAQETLQRLLLWVVPSLVLIAHFHFAPLPAANSLAVIAHLLGDPIDSIWSMLTRQEACRRFYRRAASSKLLPKQAIATVWSAFDELGWRDASGCFFESLRLRDREQQPNLPSQSPEASSSQVHVSLETAAPRRNGQRSNNNRRLNIWNRRSVEPQDTSFNVPPDEVETYYIELAAQRLTSNRSDSQLTTWVAILAMFGGLGGAYVRTWMNRSNNQTSHTIAVVVLLFIFISLVKISGNIGAFTSSSAVIDIIQELRRNLQKYNEDQGLAGRAPLFPAISLDENARWDGIPLGSKGIQAAQITVREPTEDDPDVETALLSQDEPEYLADIKNVEKWPSMAGYLGMNSCWRPLKRITTVDNYVFSDREPFSLLVVSFLFVIGGSYAPALCLAYFTPLKGFGCRSLAWTLVAAMWVVSLLVDVVILQPCIKSAKKLWHWTIFKDSIVSVYFVGSVIFVQLGLFNSCWCRSGQLTRSKPNFVDLNPLSDSDWLQGWFLWLLTPLGAVIWIFGLIWLVGRDGDNARMLLNRDLNARQQDIIHNNRVRCGLLVEPRDEPPRRLGMSLVRLFGGLRGRARGGEGDGTASRGEQSGRFLLPVSGATTPRDDMELGEVR